MFIEGRLSPAYCAQTRLRAVWRLGAGLVLAALAAAMTLSTAAAAEVHAAPGAASEAESSAEGWEDFRFAIVADRTGGMRAGVFESAIPKINILAPDLVMSVGDLIEGYNDEREQIAAEFDELEDILSGLRMPFYRVAGNHDVSNMAMLEEWRKRYGSTWYHFVYRGALFICLDSQSDYTREDAYRSGIDREQAGWVERVLSENAGARWTFVLMHQPLWVREEYGEKGWEKVEALLAGRPHTVFAGHWHKYARHSVNGREYYILATTGGASRLRGAHAGEMDHITWVTMTADGPVIANLLLDGILPSGLSAGAPRRKGDRRPREEGGAGRVKARAVHLSAAPRQRTSGFSTKFPPRQRLRYSRPATCPVISRGPR